MSTPLSPTRRAVLAACLEHERQSFLAISPTAWWRAPAPFRGGPRAFATHLRALAHIGLLDRVDGPHAHYHVTARGKTTLDA